MALDLAIYGYDTDIGKLVIETLEELKVDIGKLYPLSPLEGEFDAVTLNGRNHMIEPVSSFDFSKAQVAMFLCPPDESKIVGLLKSMPPLMAGVFFMSHSR